MLNKYSSSYGKPSFQEIEPCMPTPTSEQEDVCLHLSLGKNKRGQYVSTEEGGCSLSWKGSAVTATCPGQMATAQRERAACGQTPEEPPPQQPPPTHQALGYQMNMDPIA